jgi:hypothetical protein
MPYETYKHILSLVEDIEIRTGNTYEDEVSQEMLFRVDMIIGEIRTALETGHT